MILPRYHLIWDTKCCPIKSSFIHIIHEFYDHPPFLPVSHSFLGPSAVWFFLSSLGPFEQNSIHFQHDKVTPSQPAFCGPKLTNNCLKNDSKKYPLLLDLSFEIFYCSTSSLLLILSPSSTKEGVSGVMNNLPRWPVSPTARSFLFSKKIKITGFLSRYHHTCTSIFHEHLSCN